jgi:hypothetical protein
MFKKVLLISLILLILFTLKIEAGLIVKSKLVHQFEVGAGDKKERKIMLENNSKHEIKVRLYKRDYSFNAKGKSFYRKPGINSRSNAKWIYLQNQSLSISPFEKVSVRYKISIPDKQNLKGTYWSMIMVEESDYKVNKEREAVESHFKHKVRYGIQIVTNLGRKSDIKIEYKNPEVKKKNDKDYNFAIDILNKGIFELKMKPQVIIFNENTGAIIDKYIKNQVRLYPAASIAVKEDISLDKNVPYRIIVIVGNNGRGYFGKEYSIRGGK